MKCVFFPEPGYAGDQWFAPTPNRWENAWIALRDRITSAGLDLQVFPCDVDRKNDIGVYFDTPRYNAPLVEKSMVIMLEPPVVHPRQYERMKALGFKRVLTFMKEAVDNSKVFYSPFPLIKYTPTKEIERTKKVCAIYGNKMFDGPGELYTARRQQILSWGMEIDLYGRGWEKDQEIIETVNWCGPFEGNKVDLLRQYTYTVNYENCNLEGYATEKWGDAIQAGCVPIRRGWEPSYSIEDVFEDKWSEHVFSHLTQIL